MNRSSRSIDQSLLCTNFSILAHEFIRELAMGCKKISIYGPSHPVSARGLEKAFLVANRVFRAKRYLNLNIADGKLYVLNVRLKDGLFCQEIIQYLEILDISTITFERCMTMTEFISFAGRLLKRVDLTDHSNLLSNFLKQNKITSIEVNSETGLNLFESGRTYRGDINDDFSVKRIVMDRLGDDFHSLIYVQPLSPEALLSSGIDFDSDIISYLLPEKLSSISSDEIITTIDSLLQNISSASDAEEKKRFEAGYRSACGLIDYHTDRDKIVQALSQIVPDGTILNTLREAQVSVGSIRQESSDRIEELLQKIGTDEGQLSVTLEFGDCFERLLKTGQAGKALSIFGRLLDGLSDSRGSVREWSLECGLIGIERLGFPADDTVFEKLIGIVTDRLVNRSETFEYSELIWQLLKRCLFEQRYESMANLTSSMATRRSQVDDVTVYDSLAVKHAFANLNRREVVDRLINEMIRVDYARASHIRRVLIALGSEEVALALAGIISHPTRSVRQQALKILAELGKASLRVFSDILANDDMFIRDSGRRELPDGKWYTIRNSIFVLGSLKDPQGVGALRLRFIDPDVRVRRDIVSALEKIGGEEAVDCLALMAHDSDREISECAVIAIGLCGTVDAVPLLIDVVDKRPHVSICVVNALGKIGGHDSREFLARLLADPTALADISSGQVSREELKLATVKALGVIGDGESIEHLKTFNDGLSTTHKILFKSSIINKTLSDILSRK